MVALNRMSEKIFSTQTWRLHNSDIQELKSREWVAAVYEELRKSFSWYQEKTPTILPLYHGTASVIAEKICETGL